MIALISSFRVAQGFRTWRKLELQALFLASVLHCNSWDIDVLLGYLMVNMAIKNSPLTMFSFIFKPPFLSGIFQIATFDYRRGCPMSNRNDRSWTGQDQITTNFQQPFTTSQLDQKEFWVKKCSDSKRILNIAYPAGRPKSSCKLG